MSSTSCPVTPEAMKPESQRKRKVRIGSPGRTSMPLGLVFRLSGHGLCRLNASFAATLRLRRSAKPYSPAHPSRRKPARSGGQSRSLDTARLIFRLPAGDLARVWIASAARAFAGGFQRWLRRNDTSRGSFWQSRECGRFLILRREAPDAGRGRFRGTRRGPIMRLYDSSIFSRVGADMDCLRSRRMGR
jgi:hypothetical protein